jgi:hypothetical protein
MSRDASPVLEKTTERTPFQITLAIGVFSRDIGYLLLATTSCHNPPRRSPEAMLGSEESGYDSCVTPEVSNAEVLARQ